MQGFSWWSLDSERKVKKGLSHPVGTNLPTQLQDNTWHAELIFHSRFFFVDNRLFNLSPAWEKKKTPTVLHRIIFRLPERLHQKNVLSKEKIVASDLAPEKCAWNCVSSVDLHVELGINVNVKREETNKPSWLPTGLKHRTLKRKKNKKANMLRTPTRSQARPPPPPPSASPCLQYPVN